MGGRASTNRRVVAAATAAESTLSSHLRSRLVHAGGEPGGVVRPPHGQGPPELRLVGDRRCQALDDVVPGGRDHPDGQVGGELPLRLGGVEEASGHVEAVAGGQLDREDRLARVGSRALPRLRRQRVLQHGREDGPRLGARQLEHEDVVGVVVHAEAAGAGGRDVGVGLDGVRERELEGPAEPGEHRLRPLQALKDDGGPTPELLEDARRVTDAGHGLAADAGRAGVGGRVQRLAVPHEAKGGKPR
jgi:hypothetical protein